MSFGYLLPRRLFNPKALLQKAGGGGKACDPFVISIDRDPILLSELFPEFPLGPGHAFQTSQEFEMRPGDRFDRKIKDLFSPS